MPKFEAADDSARLPAASRALEDATVIQAVAAHAALSISTTGTPSCAAALPPQGRLSPRR
jgi:hypothetical protein